MTRTQARLALRHYTVSQTTHIREIAEYGAPGQHTLPEDQTPASFGAC